MAKRIPPHIRTRFAVSDALLQLAFKVANDTFDQKWSNAGDSLLTASLSHLSSEVVYINRRLVTIEHLLNLKQRSNVFLKVLSKTESGRAILKKHATKTKDIDIAAILEKLSRDRGEE